jgi:hypothetical protein
VGTGSGKGVEVQLSRVWNYMRKVSHSGRGCPYVVDFLRMAREVGQRYELVLNFQNLAQANQ